MSDLQALIVAGETNWLQYGDVTAVINGDLILFNYTQAAQIKGRWNYFETVSRGLILNRLTGEIVARPFDKFFNWGERTTDRKLIEATEKMDGSLGVLYRQDGKMKIATRGSFTSDQAIWATKWLWDHYDTPDGVLAGLPDDVTLLFEIIYPENRIVVDYKGYEGLVLIGARSRKYGIDWLYRELEALAYIFKFRLPKVYSFESIRDVLLLAAEIDANQEGWVLRYAGGERFKVKGDQYKVAHKLMTGISFNRVLEAMANGTLDLMIDGIPDEFLETVHRYRDEIRDKVSFITIAVVELMMQAPRKNRKEFAQWVNKNCPTYAKYMFNAFDGRDFQPLIYANAFKDRVSKVEIGK